MIPGALAVQWYARYFDMYPRDACLLVREQARRDFELVWGPRLEAEMIIDRVEALMRTPLAPMERAEAEAIRFRGREVIAALERAAENWSPR